ncbi:uncharacterized protein LOC124361384 [Homalodisca vitripennis]|uniref:uncharacterized protein LOC124361384 n=1 Tax=Homalodisca vitripennis TaxID=197043 RepID=UPI001EEB0CA8|nr:uncharacterized protein LOC124361384 [Homalodisca vitripennis]
MDSDQSAKLRDDYNLMFVVRDWVYEEDHSFGLEGGKTYIERDSERGSRELKNLWSEIKRTFSDLQCLLLPFPGSAVEKEFAKTGDLNELDKEFLKQVKSFITNIFAPKNLVPPKTKLTGEGVYRLLMSVDGKIADDNLSFLNMFTENINFYKESQLLARFPGGFQDLDLLQKLKTEIETEGENAFRGQSKTRFNERLKRTLEQMMNSEVIQKVYKKYKDNFSSSKRTKQCHEIWKGCVSLLDKYMCGNTATRIQTREKAVQKMSDVYYRQLYEEVYNDFKDSIKDLKELEELTGLDDKTVKERFLKLDDFTDIVDTNVIHPIWLKYHQNLKCCVTEHFLKKIEELTGAENLENVRAEQYKFYEACTLLKKNGDIWDSIPGDKTLLFKKVGYALFGPPKQVIHTEIRPTQTDTNKKLVGFFKTPASSAKSKALEAADKVEKVISVGAGVAGVAALVVAAPVLAPCAVVGGAAAGIYGFGRCVVKILDKKKHNEPYAKEVVKGAFNVIAVAVAAAGALRVAEGAVVIGIKGNYGKELFERVLQEYQVDQLQQVDSDPKGLTCVQAWYGMADNLNCYYSSCCDDPEELFDKLFPKKYNRDNFEEREKKLFNLLPDYMKTLQGKKLKTSLTIWLIDRPYYSPRRVLNWRKETNTT